MTGTSVADRTDRVLAIDALRGLVLLLLIPDVAGGFAVYRVAESLPDSRLWQALAAQLQHVDWQGAALWDLVMPLFVFVVGVSMAFSYAGRRSSGHGEGQMLVHALIRSLTLFTLGMVLQFRTAQRFDEILAPLLLSTGLPVGRWWGRVVDGQARPDGPGDRFDAGYSVLVLAVVWAWVAAHYEQLGHYELGGQILTVLGLSYLPAFLIQRGMLRTQAAWAAALLIGYGIAFAVYAAIMHGGAATSAFTASPSNPTDWAAWRPGAHVAAAFDHWLFGMLPRGEPYRGNPHDYHTLLVVPVIASIVFGSMTGHALLRHGVNRQMGWRLAGWAIAGLLLTLPMSAWFAPLVKSLWTPTWVIFSTGIALLTLAVLLLLRVEERRPAWTVPLIVLGSNSVLLYVLASTQRWRLAQFFERLAAPSSWTGNPLWPLAESMLVLGVFWFAAWALYRARVFIRL